MKNKSLIKKILVGLVIVIVVGFVMFIIVMQIISERGVDPGFSSALDIELRGCKKRVHIKDARDICFKERYDMKITPAGDTQRERKEAIKKLAYSTLVKYVKQFNYSNASEILAGKNVCDIFIKNRGAKNHQYDEVKILFCNDNKEVVSLLSMTSRGVDNKGNEYLSYGLVYPDVYDVPPEINSYIGATLTLHGRKFNNVGVGDNYKGIVSLIDSPIDKAIIGYKISVTRTDGVKDVMYVEAFSSTTFTKEELNLLQKEFFAREKIEKNLDKKQREEILKNSTIKEYIDKVLPPSKKLLELRENGAEFKEVLKL